MINPTQSIVKTDKTVQICLVILTILAVLSVLSYTKPVLVPLVFAIFTYAIFAPIIYWIQVHLKVPRLIAVSVAFMGVIAFSSFVVIVLSRPQTIDRRCIQLRRLPENILTSVQMYLPRGVEVT